MINESILIKKIDTALNYLYNQEEKLRPILDKLTDIISDKLKTDELDAKEAFNMLTGLQDQYTNSILLITKLKEILDFKG